MLSQDRIRNRKGVSIMVGYVLLVVFAVILSVVTYNWIRTYVPAEPLQCSDGVSVFIKSTDYNCSTNQINITVKNNGRFDILGYFIHAANESGQEIATIDLSQYLNESFEGQKFGSSVAFIPIQENSFRTGQNKTNIFDLPIEINNITLIQIIPTRFQEQDNRKRFISCGDAKIKQQVTCDIGIPPTYCGDGAVQTPNDDGQNEQCDDENTVDGDGCSSCIIDVPTDCNNNNVIDLDGEICDGTDLAGETCMSQGYDRGVLTCDSSCGFDLSGCSTCGDGTIDTGEGEECDDGNTVDGDGCSSSCLIEGAWVCSGEPSVCTVPGGFTDCNINCRILGYAAGNCVSPSECTGTLEFSGNQYCGAGEGRCCCTP